MTTKLYLDTRYLNEAGEAPLNISICKHGDTAYYPIGIRIEPVYWDRLRQKIVGHPNQKFLRTYVEDRKTKFDNILLRLEMDGMLGGLSSKQIRDKVAAVIDPEEGRDETLFMPYFKRFSEQRNKPNTRRIYLQTYDKLAEYLEGEAIRFESITKRWLEGFESYLANERGNSTNTIAIDMRNIRAVVNDAIDNDITSNYPFRKKYRIKQKKTRKRALSVKKLRELFDYEVEPFMQKYIDTFKLTFFLIGINPADLCGGCLIEDGRLVYDRSKTGRLYSIKIEPEAAELLKLYKGKAHVFGLAEGCKDYVSFVGNCDKYLKQIGPVELIPNPNKAKWKRARSFLKVRHSAFPEISIYWARHTWATIAASIDIPRETISAALGHGYGNQTTAIYIDFDRDKVDEANRKVIDYVLKK